MAASQATLELRNNTDANFRLWGKFISDGLLAGGWTKEDTDIDWSTVAAPAQNTYAGYEIWKSPAEAGLTPFYLKLRYGSHNNATIGPALEWQVSWDYSGTGSSLGGTPTAAVTSQAASAAASATPRICTIAAGTGYALINLGNVSVACNQLLAIQRTKGSNLENQNQISIFGRYLVTTASTSNLTTYLENGSSVVSSSFPAPLVLPPSTVALGAVARGRVALGWVAGFGEGRTSPGELFLGCIANALGSGGQTITIPVYGVDRTFMIGDIGSSATPAAFDASGTYQSLFLFD